MQRMGFKKPGIKDGIASRQRAAAFSMGREVDISHLSADRPLPLVIRPNLRGIQLPIWVEYNLEFIEDQLAKYGGILFRGFDVKSSDDFQRVLQSLGVQLMYYMEGATPRVEVGNKVYTSTEFPPDQTISIHNELCYVTTWPMKIWFYCPHPAEEGGQTPIGDVRKVFNRINPETLAPFIEKGWMLVRNFGAGFGPSWQTSYRVEDKSALEAYFNQASINYEWKSADHLKTWQVRPAVARHPKTGEMVWFNHIGFWHVSSLNPGLRDMFLAEFGEEGLPYNTYYGDGTPIRAEVIEEIRRAYEEETVAFLWEKGDILMLDNMLVAHGRCPYKGTRKVLVSMGEPSGGGNV